jgi:epoxyqueuosine reductase
MAYFCLKTTAMDKKELSIFLKNEAISLGFEGIAFAKAEEMTEEARRLEAWLNKGYQGEMSYMENHFDKRIDPRKLVEGAKTVISLMFNYFPEQQQSDPESPKLAKYAYGEDYHFVLKDKLKTLLQRLKDKIGDINGRCFVDSAPVLERDWAKRSGLGWIGKNTLLITPRKGSFFFLAELIVDVEFEYDAPIKDYCGSCRRCIDACPTDAISEKGYLMDASKCISYLTIELRNEIPKEFTDKMENWFFGCDICQDVCPWNRFSKAHKEPAFNPKEGLLEMKKSDWMEITEDVFRHLFKNSALKRTKYEGIVRNLNFLSPKE